MTPTDQNTLSENYSVTAFYGIDASSTSANSFYKTVVHWCAQVGYPPEKIVVHGSGYSGKYVSFNRTNSKLQKVGFDGVQDFEIYSLRPGAKKTMFDYYIDVIFNGESENNGKFESSYAAIAVSSHISTLSSDSLLPLVQAMIQSLKPVYGIGYTRQRKDGPLLYVVGIGQGIRPTSGPEYEEAVRHAHWGRLGMRRQIYREGTIRDVYPWNFLTTPHLEAEINGSSLQQWIQQDINRGSLSLLNDGVWLWDVAEPNIPGVRSTLWDAGIIFNWRNYL